MLREFAQISNASQSIIPDEAMYKTKIEIENRYNRNLKEDMKLSMDYFFEFTDKLSKLHPDVISIMDNFLRNSRNNY